MADVGLEADPLGPDKLQRTSVLVISLTATLGEPLSNSKFPNPWKVWDNKYLLSSGSFGIIWYTEIEVTLLECIIDKMGNGYWEKQNSLDDIKDNIDFF